MLVLDMFQGEGWMWNAYREGVGGFGRSSGEEREGVVIVGVVPPRQSL